MKEYLRLKNKCVKFFRPVRGWQIKTAALFRDIMKTPKRKASDACSKYIRLRDAVEYCERMKIDLSQFSSVEDLPVKCCTCPKIKTWKQMQGGHYFGRGLAGGSGAYFDERNINTQCGQCNSFRGGNIQAYREFMLQKYGQGVIDELEILHRGGRTYVDGELAAIEQLYKEMYEQLIETVI